jgi:hypothetical protein
MTEGRGPKNPDLDARYDKMDAHNPPLLRPSSPFTERVAVQWLSSVAPGSNPGFLFYTPAIAEVHCFEWSVH